MAPTSGGRDAHTKPVAATMSVRCLLVVNFTEFRHGWRTQADSVAICLGMLVRAFDVTDHPTLHLAQCSKSLLQLHILRHRDLGHLNHALVAV